MAPEVLENSLDDLLFFNFCRADMYSISLVFWEIIQRVETENIPAKTYALPYEHMVPSDPSIEDMKNVVVDSALRPDFDKMLGTRTIKILKNREGVMWWRTRGTTVTCHNKVTAIKMEHFLESPCFL